MLDVPLDDANTAILPHTAKDRWPPVWTVELGEHLPRDTQEWDQSCLAASFRPLPLLPLVLGVEPWH